MKIVFHGANASTFVPGFAELLEAPHDVVVLSDDLTGPGEPEILAGADVVVGVRLTASHPRLAARLYQVPGAGTDGIDRAALPAGCALCNCFGHEPAIAEWVMAALLSRHVPLADADARLRRGDWRYWAGHPGGLRTELGAETLGVVGWGHIGKAVAARAAAFGMTVHVANRSQVADEAVAAEFRLDALAEMAAGVDVLLVTLPLTDATRGIVGAEVLSAMKPHAIVMNVGRGAVIDEDALYDALAGGRIGGAVVDTWYVYPTPADPNPLPGNKPFHLLPNVTLTPHMSGWTTGTVSRRRAVIADNVNRLASGVPPINR
ncbi:MAG TPA: 2-hydroxyacid dehydrogenase, partial [Methylomirabilota bacterium]|nr:2-hydroxyacid dehydrogenase [Methylomirabilota bacterium]